MRDPVALGGWALSETAGDATDLHFPLCISAQTVARDVDATLRFKAGRRHPRPGRRPGPARPERQRLLRHRAERPRGLRPALPHAGRPARPDRRPRTCRVASDQWHALRVILKGNNFEVSLDDKPVFKATDGSLPQPGTVGVWSQADSVIHFGSLLVGAAGLQAAR